MRIDIITVLPEMIEGFFNCSIMKRAQDKGLAEIHIHNLRDYSEDKHRRVDDYPDRKPCQICLLFTSRSSQP
jgi:tRNA (guanine37-N1)-methyltransferase